MREPLVCAVMLTKDRPEMARRAVRLFEEQTHGSSRITILDTSAWEHMPFGVMRNRGVEAALSSVRPDILLHWDDDDWQAPERIATQVEQLMTSGAPCVGSNAGMFYDSRSCEAWRYKHPLPNYCMGASLCYWADTWRKRPFPSVGTGADEQWAESVRAKGYDAGVLQIYEVHGSNNGTVILPDKQEWMRAPGWDQYCRERLGK